MPRNPLPLDHWFPPNEPPSRHWTITLFLKTRTLLGLLLAACSGALAYMWQSIAPDIEWECAVSTCSSNDPRSLIPVVTSLLGCLAIAVTFGKGHGAVTGLAGLTAAVGAAAGQIVFHPEVGHFSAPGRSTS